jgi:hypothetical protein|tara:strand:- start:248 stop:469 length:222 start_codon:yes stop_codon:yes gene_type:complete
MEELNAAPPSFTLDDVEYLVEDISDKGKYILSQVQDMQKQASQTRMKLDQLEVGIRGFTELLKEELVAEPVED